MNKVLRTALLFCLACVSMFASAQALPISEGSYYFKTTYDSKEYFLGGANNWGTRAALIPNSVAWDLVAVGTNVYRLDSYQSNGGDSHFLGSNAYIDAGAVDIYFTEQSDGTYTLSLAADANYLQFEEMGFHNLPAINWAGDATTALKWEVISATDKSIIQQYDNVTYLVKCSNYDTNNRYRNAWTMESSNYNNNGGHNTNKVAESWRASFTLSQEIADMPNGFYTMTVQAAVCDYAGAWDGANYPVAYINDATAPFVEMENKEYVDYVEYYNSGATTTRSFNPSVTNSGNMGDFSQIFTEGLYTVKVPVLVKDGKIKLGVKGTRTDTWCVWDNFTLKFMGDDEADFATADDKEAAVSAYLSMAYDEVNGQLDALKAAVAGYDTYVQNQVATELQAIVDAVAAAKLDLDEAQGHNDCVAQKAAILAKLAPVPADIEALDAKAKTMDSGYQDLVKDFEAAEETWREATKDITKLDDKYGNEIMTTAVIEKMNEANILLKGVKDAIADGTVVIADANTDIAAALALIADAKTLAEANVKEYLALPAGEYYLKTTYDSKTYFLGGANNWGTRAALIPSSVLWNLEKVSAGVYRLDSYQSNGGGNHYLGSNAYVDAGAVDIYFTEQGEGTGVYTLSLAADAQYLAFETVGCHGLPALNWGGDKAAALKFNVVSAKAEIKKYDDVTYLIRNANFDTNNRWGGHRDYAQAWTMEAGNQNLRGGEQPNTCAESWHSTFTLSQTIEGIPNGYYTLTAQAAVRDDSQAAQDAYAAGAASFAIADAPVVFINEATAPFVEMENVKYENYTIYRWNADTYTHTFTPAINGSANMWDFSQLFAEGKYKLTVPVEVKDNKITLGAKGTRTDTWCIFDNFTLKYMGDDVTDINELPYADLKAALAQVRDEQTAAKAEVAKLDEFAQKAVKAEIDRIDVLLQDENKTHKEDIKDDKGNKTGEKTVIDVLVINQKIEAAYKAKDCAGQKDAILAELDQLSKDIAAYLENAQNLQKTNDTASDLLDAKYQELVQTWQSAYDKVNTEYKEFLNSDDEIYNGYLKQLNSLYVDIDALDATIKGYKTAGTAKANEEKTLAVIKTDSTNVENILATALNAYNDEVAADNQKAYKEVTDKADAITAAYKAAIVEVSEHYAEFHPEAAADAQVALFEIYNNVQTVKAAATKAYTDTEAKNKLDFEAEKLPLTSFVNTGYLADLDINSEKEIANIMKDVEAAAAADALARNTELAGKATEKQTKLDDLKALITTYGLNMDDYNKAIASVQGHIDAVNNATANPDHGYFALIDMTVTRRNNNNGSILQWGIYGADKADAADGDWTKVATVATPLGNTTDIKSFDSKGYQFLRFYFESNQGGSKFGHMAEFQLSVGDKKLITDAAQLSSPCSDSAEGVGDAHGLQVLLDGNAGTFWHSDWHGAYTGGTHYLQVALAEAVEPALNCAVEKTEAVNAELQAAADELAALEAAIKGERSDDLLAAIKEKAEKAKKALEEAVPETYEEAVKEMFAEDVEAITKKIDDAVAEAEAADEDGKLIAKYAEIDGKLGEAADVYVAKNVIAVTMAKGTGSSYDDNTVNGKFSIKVGTSSKTGSAHIVVPAGVSAVSFKAVAWNGIADLELSITDGSTDPAKKFTIHGNEGLAGTSPYTIAENDDMIVTYEFAAKTTAEVTLDIAADKRFIIWDAEGTDGGAAVNSAYALINHTAELAANENYNVIFTANVATLKSNLAAAKKVISDLGQNKDTEIAVINGEITAVDKKVKDNYKAITLAAVADEIKGNVKTVQSDIDALLAVVYQADLQQKIADVKTTWNVEYAKLETTGKLTADQKALFDEIYDKIMKLSDKIDATADYKAKTWAEDDAAVADLANFFSNFSDWVKNNYKLGDANLDDDITVSDAVLTVSFALEAATPNERQQYTADSNEDGTITVTDAVSTIDIALGVEPEAGVKGLDAAVPSNDYLVVNGTEISLVNEMSYRGFQMDITADGDIEVELSERAAGLVVTKNKLANGNTRIVVMAFNKTDKINGQEGLLMTIKGAKDITLSNVEFTDGKQGYELGIQVVTGINGINADFAGESIYTVGGARLSKVQKAGVYVINGKKVLVK